MQMQLMLSMSLDQSIKTPSSVAKCPKEAFFYNFYSFTITIRGNKMQTFNDKSQCCNSIKPQNVYPELNGLFLDIHKQTKYICHFLGSIMRNFVLKFVNFSCIYVRKQKVLFFRARKHSALTLLGR